ncbi:MULTISPECIES: NAD(P)/FAD-dependent oxidoreductase [Nocardia]|uniref:NAD(P)/FAD-dependent oxidoreductase n=1 Tax=Nocardia TaxID=1817 RepID=UPI0018E549ED|nr:MULTISPECIES: FAD-dependent oxidoreductase [Nocardia]
MSTSKPAGRGTAVVIGGGMAGTLAAWALRGHASRIIVIERDHYPEGPQFRAGTPQARHAHLLLEAGHRLLEQMFPGIRDELVAAGATMVPMATGLRWLGPAGWMASHDADIAFLSCTRALLDHVIVQRVRAAPSIHFEQGTNVVGLTGGPYVIDGVRTVARGTGVRSVIDAEMVIDASGRSSALPRWLKELRCPPVAEERVDPNVIYLSRLFHRDPDTDPGFGALYLQTRAPLQRGTGSLLPVENGRWLCSLGSMAETEKLSGERGFDTLLSRMRDPILRETIAGLTPAGDIRGFRPGVSVRRHYQRTAPDGLVVLGDAETNFNPVYGQGMTAAAFGAHALHAAVAGVGGIGHDAARVARAQVAAVSRDPWLMSAGEDARFPQTIGGPSGAMARWQHRYLDRVLSHATHDPAVAAAFTRVMSLLDPPTTLLRPRVLAPVLLGIR